MTKKPSLYTQAKETFYEMDTGRAAFIAAIKILETREGNFEKKQLAKGIIGEFMRIRALETKKLRMIIKMLNAHK